MAERKKTMDPKTASQLVEAAKAFNTFLPSPPHIIEEIHVPARPQNSPLPLLLAIQGRLSEEGAGAAEFLAGVNRGHFVKLL